jgi:hypothetical protein
MIQYPKVKSVQPLKGKQLLVTFSNSVRKVYDCTPLLRQEVYLKLSDEALFQNVRADQGGYGVSWDDEIDLAESELWINGLPAEHSISNVPENLGAID